MTIGRGGVMDIPSLCDHDERMHRLDSGSRSLLRLTNSPRSRGAWQRTLSIPRDLHLKRGGESCQFSVVFLGQRDRSIIIRGGVPGFGSLRHAMWRLRL